MRVNMKITPDKLDRFPLIADSSIDIFNAPH